MQVTSYLRSCHMVFKQVLFPLQCTSDNKRCTAIAQVGIKDNTDNLHDDDVLTPADLMTFAWQIAKGMVRAGLCA